VEQFQATQFYNFYSKNLLIFSVDCLVLAGKLSAYKQTCETLVSHMNKIRTTLLIVDDAKDVLYESV